MTAKHLLLGMGPHNIIGSDAVFKIISKLGNSNKYETTCEIETIRSRNLQLLADRSSILMPKSRNQKLIAQNIILGGEL